ncbi:MAG: nicotinate (nicotinamide) nucleotide adenylyltransferase [Spirochaetales bacterium]|nr:nicotinate (nicotinamide) nucleotide adenylyltransferase [Spirochaetales bacterium]
MGHLFLAREARSRLGYDRILFVPAHIPVHKDVEVEVGPGHRLAMLELALEPYPEFQVDDCELERGGASYTIDTVRSVLERYAVDGKPGLLIGDDLVPGFDGWKEAPVLAQMVQLIVGRRRSDGQVRMRYPCLYLDNAVLPVSSSQVRERLQQGREIRDLVPGPVAEYILRHGLYGPGG